MNANGLDRRWLFLCDLHRGAVAEEFRFGKLLIFHGDEFEEFEEFLHRPILVPLFASPQTHGHFNRMTFRKKLFKLAHLDHEIVMGRTGADLYGFEADALLRQALFLHSFFLLIAKLVIAHKPGNRRLGVRRYLDEVNSILEARKLEGVGALHDAKIFALLADHAELRGGYLVVDSGFQNTLHCKANCANVNDPCYNRGMDEGPIVHPGVPQEVYHTLGPKTFWMFLIEEINAAIILFIISIGLFVLAGQPFLVVKQLGNLAPYVLLAADLCLALTGFVLAFTLIMVWLTYRYYKYCLGEDSLKIKRGILNKEEVAIPYRQIQDVDIKRDLYFQMLGLSRIIILTAGQEDETPRDSESEGVLPALDKDLAEWFQAELLKRANVQKVTEEK